MEQLNPNPMMGGPRPGGMMPPGAFPPNIALPRQAISPSPYLTEQEEKKKEFARGVFVSGFEKSVTTAMLQHHFSIKPIYGLRHPTTKLKESKGFAFIYYGSEDDALHVKKTLDRTAVLKAKIRVTRTVISENLSKMMFKLNTAGLEEKTIKEHESRYFGDEQLEKETERIIKPIFQNTVEVNKITIPHSKKENTPLRYARVFFYVSNIRDASEIASRGLNSEAMGVENKNEYEKILTYIQQLVNQDPVFSKYAKAEIYEYTKKNQSNVLHIKGIKHNPKEDPAALAEEIKEFVQKQGPQWNIANVYAAVYTEIGAWANVTFATYEETKDAYENFKNNRPKFRDTLIYGSLRNVKDPRTVVVSVVRKDATQQHVKRFLDDLAESSARREVQEGPPPMRKYDYFSFNIIQSKKFFKNDRNETEGVVESQLNRVGESWMELNEVPRRLVIHFFNEFTDDTVKELTNDIKLRPNYGDIFITDGDNKKQLRSNLQKGHVNKDGTYIKHTQLNKNKKKAKTALPRKGPTRGFKQGGAIPTNLNQYSMTAKGAPKFSNPGPFMRGQGMSNISVPATGNFGLPGHSGPLPGIGNAPSFTGGSGIPGTMPSSNLPGTNPGNLPGMRPAGSAPPHFSQPQSGSTPVQGGGLPGQPPAFKPPAFNNPPMPGAASSQPGPLPGMSGFPGTGASKGPNLPGMPGSMPGFAPQNPPNFPKPPPK